MVHDSTAAALTPDDHQQDNGPGWGDWLTRNGLPAWSRCWSLAARVRQFVARSEVKARRDPRAMPPPPILVAFGGVVRGHSVCVMNVAVASWRRRPNDIGGRVRLGWRRRSRCRCSRCSADPGSAAGHEDEPRPVGGVEYPVCGERGLREGLHRIHRERGDPVVFTVHLDELSLT